MTVSFSFTRGRLIVVPVHMRHTVERKYMLALDTGARVTVITPKVAEELGFDPDKIEATTTVTGATGAASAALVTVPSLSVGGLEVADLRVICYALPPRLQLEGVLGLDFLSHFKIEIDNECETVFLTRWRG